MLKKLTGTVLAVTLLTGSVLLPGCSAKLPFGTPVSDGQSAESTGKEANATAISESVSEITDGAEEAVDSQKDDEQAEEVQEDIMDGTGVKTVTASGIPIPDVDLKNYEIPDGEVFDMIRDMGVGFNLGNTFDAYNDGKVSDEMEIEEYWQHTYTTREMIKDIRALGFKSIRIPVSWHNHITDDNYTISDKWLARVNEVVDWALDEDMYVIINIHHDNHKEADGFYPDSESLDKSKKYIKRIWEQLSERFKDYDEHLIFEAMNEPRLVGHENEWWINEASTDCKDAIKCINELNRTFVDTVRASGGNNLTRYLMCPGYDASVDGATNAGFELPAETYNEAAKTDDPDNPNMQRIIVSVHAYTPYNFALEYPGISDFDAASTESTKEIDTFMDKLYDKYISKGIPVIIGEFGARDKSGNLEDRVNFTAYYVANARARGMSCLWWDNNAFSGDGEVFGVYNRKEPEKTNYDIVDALMCYADLSEGTVTASALKDAYKDFFKTGVAVQAIDHWNDPTAEIGNPDKEKLITEQFNSITFGNELKPAYNFDPESETLFTADPAAEELLKWARDNDMPVRGHTLVWHSQVDPSIFAVDFRALKNGKQTFNEKDELDKDCLIDRGELIKRLKTYIYGAIEYTYKNGYADTIYAWDVVNEAVDENEGMDGLRQSYWYRIIGPEYLYLSFLYAREATVKYSKEYASLYGLDPEKDDLSPIIPQLFYNDYNEWYKKRCDITIRMLTEDKFNASQSLAKSDVIKKDGDGTIYGDGLVDGIGMQGHLDDTQDIDEYMTALERYNAAIPNIHITELDVGKNGSGDEAYKNQAEFYNEFFLRLVDEKKNGAGLNCVTFWGLTDDASWRKGADPLLYNGDLSPKAAYTAVVNAAYGKSLSGED